MNRMKELREGKKMSMAQVSRELKIPYTTYVSYEKGEREPSMEMLVTLAEYFKVTVDHLIGGEGKQEASVLFGRRPENVMELPKTKRIPLVGSIACGEPILAEENIECFLEMPAEIDARFCLRCRGDSMINARIFNGDIVYIREQPTVENGEIAAVLIGNEATLKRVYLSEERLILHPENPMYPDIVLNGEEMNNATVLGKAVAFFSAVR